MQKNCIDSIDPKGYSTPTPDCFAEFTKGYSDGLKNYDWWHDSWSLFIPPLFG
jgi:hypothetical protein